MYVLQILALISQFHSSKIAAKNWIGPGYCSQIEDMVITNSWEVTKSDQK